MSCIVALQNNGVVYMGCDSAFTLSDGAVWEAKSPRKIITVPIEGNDEQVLIGVTGDAAVLCTLHDELAEETLEKSVTFSYVKTLLTSILEKASLWKSFNRHSDDGSAILVGMNGSMYLIVDKDCWLEVAEPQVVAIGSGGWVAQGALTILEKARTAPNLPSPAEPMLTALETAAQYDHQVKKPFHLLSTIPYSDEEA